jgi:hypothetical protein
MPPAVLLRALRKRDPEEKGGRASAPEGSSGARLAQERPAMIAPVKWLRPNRQSARYGLGTKIEASLNPVLDLEMAIRPEASLAIALRRQVRPDRSKQ